MAHASIRLASGSFSRVTSLCRFHRSPATPSYHLVPATCTNKMSVGDPVQQVQCSMCWSSDARTGAVTRCPTCECKWVHGGATSPCALRTVSQSAVRASAGAEQHQAPTVPHPAQDAVAGRMQNSRLKYIPHLQSANVRIVLLPRPDQNRARVVPSCSLLSISRDQPSPRLVANVQDDDHRYIKKGREALQQLTCRVHVDDGQRQMHVRSRRWSDDADAEHCRRDDDGRRGRGGVMQTEWPKLQP